MEFEFDLDERKLELINVATRRALEQTADQLLVDVVQSQSMPFETGFMQNDQTACDFSNSSKGEVNIVTSTPYARRLYYHPEYNFRTDKNPNAGGMWWEPYLSGDKKELPRRLFQALVEREIKKL